MVIVRNRWIYFLIEYYILLTSFFELSSNFLIETYFKIHSKDL
jgi:hypothetical protein